MNRWAKEVPKQRARVRLNLTKMPAKQHLTGTNLHRFDMEMTSVINKIYKEFRGALVMVTITRMGSFGGPRKKARKKK